MPPSRRNTEAVLSAIEEVTAEVADLSLEIAFSNLDAAMSEGAIRSDPTTGASVAFAVRRVMVATEEGSGLVGTISIACR